jgi:GT2 family glycosyltransferase
MHFQLVGLECPCTSQPHRNHSIACTRFFQLHKVLRPGEFKYTVFTVPTPASLASQYDVSIVIVSFNTREVLRECLQSVLLESADLHAEVLLVDNNSADGSAQMVEQDFPQVRLFRSETNLGFGAANNLALREATGRYFVLLNSDAFFEPGALHLAIQHMEATPQCGLGGARLIGRDGAAQPSARSFHTILADLAVFTGLAGKFPNSRVFGKLDRTWADRDQAALVDWVPGAFSIIRPDTLRKIGLFDPRFFLYYEEVDLCRRIKEEGYQIWYWPDIVVIHIGGESSRQLKSLAFSSQAAQVVMWRMRSTLLYYRKHHGAQVYLAKWMEICLYRLVILRNSLSSSPLRKERGQRHRTLIALMKQAWKDTHGGHLSPPRPW